MKCIIIEDEPESINVLKTHISRVPYLELVDYFRQPLKALSYLRNYSADLIFLDINMPGLTGIDLVKILPHKPLIIFTTAYAEYAAESYEYNAVDYLVKPIQFERFLKAVLKANDKITGVDGKPASERRPVLLKSGTVLHKVLPEDILFVEKKDNYLSFQTIDRKILVRGNMSDVFKMIPERHFCRVHKSFIVSVTHVNAIELNQIHIKDHIIPIGETYRQEVFKTLTEK